MCLLNALLERGAFDHQYSRMLQCCLCDMHYAFCHACKQQSHTEYDHDIVACHIYEAEDMVAHYDRD